MEIVKKKLSELKHPEKNVRRHTEKQLKEYVRSVNMFGQTRPILCAEDGEIIVGNGLYEAMKRAGMEEADCVVMYGLTDKQRKKLMLADNRVYELGITDTAVFDAIIKDLDGDIDVPGWDEDLLEMLNQSVSETNDMIENYGTYPQEEVDRVNDRRTAVQMQEKAALTQQAQPPITYASAPSPATEPGAAVQRYIICPHCGERICL